MLKLSTASRFGTALALVASWCCAASAGAASLDALPIDKLIAALGHGGPGGGVQICLEIARRFDQTSPSDRSTILSRLATVLESDPQPAARFGAIACLTGLASAPPDEETRAVLAEIVRDVLHAERDPVILTAAVRLLPDVDQSPDALLSISDLLNDSRLMRVHPELTKEALLGAGRLGPQAVFLLRSFLPTDPESAMIALSATDSEEAVDVLVGEAGGSDPDRRSYAVHALGLCAGSEKLPAEAHALILRTLERAAQADRDPNVRQKALEWLSAPRTGGLEHAPGHDPVE